MPRGGYRSGAGRPTGSLSKTTSEQSQRLSELAKDYTHLFILSGLMALFGIRRLPNR